MNIQVEYALKFKGSFYNDGTFNKEMMLVGKEDEKRFDMAMTDLLFVVVLFHLHSLTHSLSLSFCITHHSVRNSHFFSLLSIMKFLTKIASVRSEGAVERWTVVASLSLSLFLCKRRSKKRLESYITQLSHRNN